MTRALFAYPEKAAFNRVVPKSKVYEHAKPTRALRDRFVAEVEQIKWRYKLSPETTNLPPRGGVEEIQVFQVQLKTADVSEAVLRCIDKAVSFPLFFELVNGEQVRGIAAYKRPSDAEAGRWVVDSYFETPWVSVETARQPFPVALDLGGLYESLLLSHIALTRRPTESLRELVARAQEIQTKEVECAKLEQRLRAEQQFNRRVEINGQLRVAKESLDALRA